MVASSLALPTSFRTVMDQSNWRILSRLVSFVLLLAEAKFLIWNLFKLTSYGKFGFSRLDLDGNKLAKGMHLARKTSDRGVFI